MSFHPYPAARAYLSSPEFVGMEKDLLEAELIARYELSDVPKASKVFSLAWEYGHSSGVLEVLDYFDDMIGLVAEKWADK